MKMFLPAMWPAFFMRVSPASRKAKPACMNITSTAVTITQIVLAAINRSEFLGTDFHLLQALARSVVHDVVDWGCPDNPVPGLAAAARRVDDGADDRFGLRLVRHEHRRGPLPDHHRLHLRHCSHLLWTTKKAPGTNAPEASLPPISPP